MNHEQTKSRLLRTLLKESKWMREGELANYIKLNMADPEFEESLKELASSGLVSVSFSGFGRSRRVELTPEGYNEASRLKADRNREILKAVEAK